MKRTQTTNLATAQKRTLLFIAPAALGLTVLLANYLMPRNVPSVDPTVSIERAQNDDSSNSRAAPGAASPVQWARLILRLITRPFVALPPAPECLGLFFADCFPPTCSGLQPIT